MIGAPAKRTVAFGAALNVWLAQNLPAGQSYGPDAMDRTCQRRAFLWKLPKFQ